MNDHVTNAEPVRLGRLSADRLCVGCGHNLVNQEIVREPHYGLLVVRCPECGRAASMEEYPVLGTWARRLGMLLAGLVLFVLVAAWAATSGATTGFGFMIAENASRPFSQYLDRRHASDAAAESATPLRWEGESSPNGAATLAFGTWLARHEPGRLFADAWRDGGLHPSAQDLAIGALSIAAEFAFGTTWTALLAGTRRRRLVLFALPMLGLSALFSSVIYLDWTTRIPGNAWGAAQAIVGLRLLPFVLLGLGVGFVAGLAWGRPIVRGLVRLLLPPRLRGALAVLWTVDGLPVPR